MEKGELESEPELHLDARERHGNKKAEMEWDTTGEVGMRKKSKGKDVALNAKRTGRGIAADTFFGVDNEEENEGMDEDEDESDR
jgi:hypothetical protein